MLIQVDTSDALRTCTAWAAIGLKVVPARLTGATSVIASSSDVSFSWVGGGGGGEAEGRRWGGGGGFFSFPIVYVCRYADEAKL